jgi:predicted phage terminase large subunit-like protein
MSHNNWEKIFPGKFLKYNFKSFLLKCFYTLAPGTKFIDNWHIDLILEYLEEIERCHISRLIINVPPRSLKSTIISVSWPAWLLGQNPTRKIIVASYSLGLSLKHSQDTRLIMNSHWYKRLFPLTRIAKGANEKSKFVTTQQGFRFATSISGTLTGEGADILIVDDPVTPLQAASKAKRSRVLEWFEQTFSTRLNDKKNGAIVVIMQRLHVDDLSGYLLQKKFWQTLILPAVCEQDTLFKVGRFTHLYKQGDFLNPKREGNKEIELAKLELGSYGFNAQYQQSPLRLNNGIIQASWIERYVVMPTNYDLSYQSWDCAISTSAQADYSVCSTWGIVNQQIYLLDIFRQQLDFISLKKMVISLYEDYKPAGVIIENKASGQPLIQEFTRTSFLPVIKYLPTNDKVNRLLMVSSMFESRKILFPQNASWLAELESELFHFPHAKHDDQVDSISQFLLWFKSKNVQGYNIRKC